MKIEMDLLWDQQMATLRGEAVISTKHEIWLMYVAREDKFSLTQISIFLKIKELCLVIILDFKLIPDSILLSLSRDYLQKWYEF